METTQKKQSFQDIINSPTPTLVDFFATWCGPCVAMTPVLKAFKTEVGDQVNVIKVDVDRNPQVANAFQIHGVPTFILFKEGKPVWRESGMQSVSQLKQALATNSQ